MSIYGKLIKNPIIATVMSHIETYPTPINLTYLWGFGSLAGLALGSQIITGVLLAMHYASEVTLAFASVEHIMRDVKGGAILRYIHANGASMFLLIVYSHMFRGLYFGSYFQPRANLWYSGIVIFLAMMATAFMGYVLPWGQMSFWGATVITNLFSAIPYIGDSIVQLLWGGFSVDNPTLNRFFSLHYLVPFIIAGLAFLHLILLHLPGSNNPLGISAIYDKIPFYPYFYVKDLFGFFVFVLIFSTFVIYAPNYLGHPDNYIEANPLVTPAHIVPEWYFLPFYAVLRSIPDKLGGVVLMVVAILILAILPIVDTSVFRSTFFKPLNLWLFWFFFANSICLGWIGQEIVESPFIEMGVFVTSSYFIFFIALLPLAGFLENSILSSFFTVEDSENIESISRERVSGINSKFASSSIFFLLNVNEFFQFGFIFMFILFLALFFYRQGESTKFLNKIGFLYLIFVVLLSSLDYLELSETLFSQIEMSDSLVMNPSSNLDLNMFAKLFAFYSFLITAIFLYGVADRFFISNSYEIEFILLVFFLHTGALLLFAVNNLLEFILAIEIVTLAMYALTTFSRQNRFGAYAGVQYFILGSVPSGLLVLGLTLLYKVLGSYEFSAIELLLTENLNLFENKFKSVTQAFEQGDIQPNSGSDFISEFYDFLSAFFMSAKANYFEAGSHILSPFEHLDEFLSVLTAHAVDYEKILNGLSDILVTKFTTHQENLIVIGQNIDKAEAQLIQLQLENTTIKSNIVLDLTTKTSLSKELETLFSDLLFAHSEKYQELYEKNILLNNKITILNQLELKIESENELLQTYEAFSTEILNKMEVLFNKEVFSEEDTRYSFELSTILNFILDQIALFDNNKQIEFHDLSTQISLDMFNQVILFNEVENMKQLLLTLHMNFDKSQENTEILFNSLDSLYRNIESYCELSTSVVLELTPTFLNEINILITIVNDLITLGDTSNFFVSRNLEILTKLKTLIEKRDLLIFSIVETIQILDEELLNISKNLTHDLKTNLEYSAFFDLRILPTLSKYSLLIETTLNDLNIFDRLCIAFGKEVTLLSIENESSLKETITIFDSLKHINEAIIFDTYSFFNNSKMNNITDFDYLESIYYEVEFLAANQEKITATSGIINKNLKDLQSYEDFWLIMLNRPIYIFDAFSKILPEQVNIYAALNSSDLSETKAPSTFNFSLLDTSDFVNILDYNFLDRKFYDLILLLSIFLIFFNLLFKITAAPFHFWAPSIYGKTPLASVTFMSIFSKAMVFFAIAKFLITIFHSFYFIFLPFLLFVSILSVLFGMLGAFAEKGIKRFFVYSSMGHVGFMLLGLSLSTREGFSATFHYLPVYIVTSFIMWFTIMHLGESNNNLAHFSIIKNSNPLLALIFSLIVFSMSGIPPLGGFFVKLDILAALLESSQFYVNYMLLFFTVASFFYYLRLVKIIFFDESSKFDTKYVGSEERLWLISILFIILLFYIFLIEKPLVEIQIEALTSLY